MCEICSDYAGRMQTAPTSELYEKYRAERLVVLYSYRYVYISKCLLCAFGQGCSPTTTAGSASNILREQGEGLPISE